MSAETNSAPGRAASASGLAEKVRRVRAQIGRKIDHTAPPLPEVWLPSLKPLAENQRTAQNLAEAIGVVNPRPAGLANQLIQRSKRALARSLEWQVRPQREFNRNVAEALLRITETLEHTGKALQRLRHQLNLQRWAAEGELVRQTESVQQLEQRLLSLRQQLASQPVARAASDSSGATATQRSSRPLQLDYFQLERQFRGTEEQIRQRQSFYLPFFRGCRKVLDIACGRGEFLELVQEAGAEARGVDLDAAMVARCREKGLNVERADVFEFLEKIADKSLDGIFSSQFVEHLEPTDYTYLVGQCVAKLAPGGVLAIETQNPECLAIFSQSFFIDPTHVKPIAPAQLRFLFAEQGLERITTHFLSPAGAILPLLPQLASSVVEADALRTYNAAISRFNETFFGGMDYAVIGYLPPSGS
jgi:O-antigen chain-terminating methyltransferase